MPVRKLVPLSERDMRLICHTWKWIIKLIPLTANAHQNRAYQKIRSVETRMTSIYDTKGIEFASKELCWNMIPEVDFHFLFKTAIKTFWFRFSWSAIFIDLFVSFLHYFNDSYSFISINCVTFNLLKAMIAVVSRSYLSCPSWSLKLLKSISSDWLGTVDGWKD